MLFPGPWESPLIQSLTVTSEALRGACVAGHRTSLGGASVGRPDIAQLVLKKEKNTWESITQYFRSAKEKPRSAYTVARNYFNMPWH